MLGTTLGVTDYLGRVAEALAGLDPAQVENLSDLIEDGYHAGRFVFICGNGGSGANASHLCEDLAKCTLRDFENQKRLKVLSLTDNTAGIMAWANDEGYDRDLRRAAQEPRLARRPPAGDLGLGQQPEHPQGRRVGQRPRPDDRRASPASAAASSRPWPSTTCTSASTTWGSSSRSTRSSSTGSSTTSTAGSGPRDDRRGPGSAPLRKDPATSAVRSCTCCAAKDPSSSASARSTSRPSIQGYSRPGTSTPR